MNDSDVNAKFSHDGLLHAFTQKSASLRPIKVREMPLRHFTSFLSGHWVQGSPLPPTAKVIGLVARLLRNPPTPMNGPRPNSATQS